MLVFEASPFVGLGLQALPTFLDLSMLPTAQAQFIRDALLSDFSRRSAGAADFGVPPVLHANASDAARVVGWTGEIGQAIASNGNGSQRRVSAAPTSPSAVSAGAKTDENPRIVAAKAFPEKVQRDAALLAIAQDSSEKTKVRCYAASYISDRRTKDDAYLSIARDPRVHISSRLGVINIISNGALKEDAYLSIVEDSALHHSYRFSALREIKEVSKRDRAHLAIAKYPSIELSERLRSASVITSAKMRDEAHHLIVVDPRVPMASARSAADLITDKSRKILAHVWLDLASGNVDAALKRVSAVEEETSRDELLLLVISDWRTSLDDKLKAAMMATNRDAAFLMILKNSGRTEIDSALRINTDDAWIAVAQDRVNIFQSIPVALRFIAASQIRNDLRRSHTYETIANDPLADASLRLMAANLIADEQKRNRAYEDIILMSSSRIRPEEIVRLVLQIKNDSERRDRLLTFVAEAEHLPFNVRKEAAQNITDEVARKRILAELTRISDRQRSF